MSTRQQWEYEAWVTYYTEAPILTGEVGKWTGRKTKAAKGYWVNVGSTKLEGSPEVLSTRDGEKLISLFDFLHRMGQDGWELVGTPAFALMLAGGGGPRTVTDWYNPSIWLIFKRPSSA